MNKLIDNINDLSNLKEDMIQHGFDRLNRKMLEDIISSLREVLSDIVQEGISEYSSEEWY